MDFYLFYFNHIVTVLIQLLEKKSFDNTCKIIGHVNKAY